MLAQASHPSVAVKLDPQHRFAGLETQKNVDYGATADRDGRYLAYPFEGAVHAGQLRPSACQALGIQVPAHPIVELTQHLVPTARGVAGDELGSPLNVERRNGASHRGTSVRVERVTEPLKRGLPARAEHVTDVSPALPGRSGSIDRRL